MQGREESFKRKKLQSARGKFWEGSGWSGFWSRRRNPLARDPSSSARSPVNSRASPVWRDRFSYLAIRTPVKLLLRHPWSKLVPLTFLLFVDPQRSMFSVESELFLFLLPINKISRATWPGMTGRTKRLGLELANACGSHWTWQGTASQIERCHRQTLLQIHLYQHAYELRHILCIILLAYEILQSNTVDTVDINIA